MRWHCPTTWYEPVHRLLPAPSQTWVLSHFSAFTYGHYAYVVGDSSTAIAYLQRSMSESGNGELQSIALTYMALSEQRLGDPAAFRQDIVRAVDLDTQEINGLGREVAAGLYTPGPPS